MNILKLNLCILPRTKNTLFLEAAKIQEIESRLKLSKINFKIKLLTHPYTKTVLTNLLISNNQKLHPDSIFNEKNRHQDLNQELSRLHLAVKTIEQIHINKMKETKENKELRNLLVNFYRNSEKIFELMRAF